MLILGLTKTTLLDYPEKVAATVFTGGCNFRCPFCHNGPFVLNPANEVRIPKEDIIEYLIKRKNVLEGVCITGGEPTINCDLEDFIKEIKEIGYLVKLDTNGTHPDMLLGLIEKKLIDYVAMDIKNSREKYCITASCEESLIDKVERSVELLKQGRIGYEFRTTVVRELHDRNDIENIASWIGKGSKWYIQSYAESDNVIEKRFSAYTKDELIKLTQNIEGIDIVLRGID